MKRFLIILLIMLFLTDFTVLGIIILCAYITNEVIGDLIYIVNELKQMRIKKKLERKEIVENKRGN